MMKTVFVLNGPNLNMLGKREPGIYGGKTLKDIEADCIAAGRDLGFSVDFRQSNNEGMLVDWLHEADEKAVGVAINAGAYTHTSIALHDAIRAISVPVVEVHISNIHAREEFRHRSMIAAATKGMICGFGPASYTLALSALKSITG
ncbi:MAG: type II 3-dehydroquinate dehydratase [Proteobacteria bacterium]|nr:type II 3-dehydroquinate dehydratase [Pseudomonadota bacterium]